MKICIACGSPIPEPLEEYGDADMPMCQHCYFAPLDPNEREIVYGFFPGGDPRDFTPDDESCSPEEIVRWKEDCEAVERGEAIGANHSGGWITFSDGTQAHVLAPRYGIGTYFHPPRQLQQGVK